MSDTIAMGFLRAEEFFVRIDVLRRHPRYRQLLARGTDLDGRITTMRVLRAVDLFSQTGAPSIGDVAERLIMEQSNASRAVDQAVEQGLLTKHPSPSDGRRTELRLTDKGRRAIRELDSRRSSVHDDLLKDWKPAEVTKLAELLGKLCTSYERVLGEAQSE